MNTRRLSAFNVFTFVLLWISFAYFYQGGFDNQNSRFDFSLALAFDHRVQIDSFHENTIDKAAIGGHYYLEKSPVVSYLTLPVALGGSLFWSTEDLQAQRWRGDLLLYLAGILILAPLSASAGVCFRLFLRVLNPDLSEGLATVLAVLVFMGTLAWPYSTMLFGHQVAASLLIVGLYLGVTAARSPTLSHFRIAGAFALLGLAVCAEYPTVVLAAACAFIIFFQARRRGMVLLVGTAFALLPLALLLIHNWVTFGSPLALGYGRLQGSRFATGMSVGLFGIGLPSFSNVLQLLFGPYRGLFFYSPLLSIACASYALWPRRTLFQVGIPSLLGSFGLVLVISGYSYWQGGVCFGPRHLVSSIPLLALGLAFLPQAWLSRPWFWGIALLSFGYNLLGVSITPFLAERQTAPLSLYIKLAKDGALALNPAGFLTPSAERRWRWATLNRDGTGAFNLGEFLGLRGWWSLLPWLFLMLVLTLILICIVKKCFHHEGKPGRVFPLFYAIRDRFFPPGIFKNTVKQVLSIPTLGVRGYALRIAPPALLFISLLLLRLQLAQDLGTGVGQALDRGLMAGTGADFSLTLLVLAGAWLIAWMVEPLWFWPTFAALALLAWGTGIAGVLYHRFFGEPLEWWIVLRQGSEVPLVLESAFALGRTPFILASILAFLFTLALSGLIATRARWVSTGIQPPPAEKRVVTTEQGMSPLIPSLFLGASSLLLINLVSSPSTAGLLEEQIVIKWWRQALGHEEKTSRPADLRAPAQQLLLFQKLETGALPEKGLTARVALTNRYRSGAGNDEPWPLYRNLSFHPKTVAEFRRSLGLPLDTPINIVVVFVESWRSFEFEHPRLGPVVFPRLRARFDRQATYFPSTYASIYPEASTTRGQFSALCSSLPHIGGPPVFLRFTGINMPCLPQLMGDNAYHTVLMSAGANEFHKTEAFFSKHGVQNFVGRGYFRQFDDEDRVGTWPQLVLSDRPFLHEALQLLEGKRNNGIREPFFAILATLSSHHPYVGILPDLDLPGADREYLGYLATMHYVDKALDHFLTELFTSRLADHTLVALIGDHGIRLPPVESLTKLQQLELISRVPMALLTNHPEGSRRIHAPVHQMDLAPTLAAVAGVSGKTSWIGRNALLGSGSPWVSSGHDSFAYRVGSRECFGGQGERPRCFHLTPGQDPLFAELLEEVEESPVLTSFMHRVVHANQRLIQFDLFAPPDSKP